MSSSEAETFVVEKVVDKRTFKGELQYLLKWEGYSSDDNTWEPASGLNCPKLVAAFEKEHAKKTAAAKRSTTKAKSAATKSATVKRKNSTRARKATSAANSTTVGKSQGNKRAKRSRSLSSSDESTDEEVEPVVFSKLPTFDTHEAKKVIGAKRVTDDKGEKHLQLLIEWKNDTENEGTFVPAVEAHLRIPQLVIDFYESRLCFTEDGEEE
eukprot:CAMPEP_0174241498 /NCGR_PEP_ID=MMETSP0417-20130205/23548_1 /TAXON_ID=242541 /ORGANISM="Mayorella sp, Strain BSH-02190019" /LENGTH=210 /DNA_ID=CAMNT_0015320745 /DNA_START=64 /DNA_END=693 /DNA_ORIENTATION=+